MYHLYFPSTKLKTYEPLWYYRVVAKKIVFWLRVWTGYYFCESPGTNFVSNLSQYLTWMRGHQASCLQDGGRSTQKENMLNMFSKQDFIPGTKLVIHVLAPILKVVRNLFQTFHLHRQFNMVHISNDCTCVT